MSGMLLSMLVFSPLVGIVILAFLPKNNEKLIKIVGFCATLLPLILAFIIYGGFNQAETNSQFVESYRWLAFGDSKDLPIQQLVINYELGITGLSLVLILLTAIVATLASIASIHIKKEWKGYFMLFLLLELGMLGVFASENLLLFFVFFELTLVPMFFLIGKWGYDDKERAAYSFLIFNGIGSAILLIVFAALFAKTGTLNINQLVEIMSFPDKHLANFGISESFRFGIATALLIAFGVKLPIFPLHSWMLRVHVQAPPAIVMIHSGILLKIGAYGLIRLGIGVFPDEFQSMAAVLAVLGVINLLYGAFLALIQSDFKMVLAYSSISHMGIVLIGLGAMNSSGIQGAIFQVISHGLISALLFFLIGVIYERVGTSRIDNLGGLAKVMPITSGFLLAGAMASLGLPGMSGFVSEFMAFLGLFGTMPLIAAIGALGIILTAAYLLRAVLNVTFGKTKTYKNEIRDIQPIEAVPIVVLLGFIIGIGVFPNILSQSLQTTLELIMLGIGG
ncbi:complex I subunit 4 family protein [Bacillus solimangrovi]|uniref:NADH-quinone oxidoreductase subunit M n=1 Tax=Bacillus solimangrovi TaxID=1305675 RepID=A0A1E5LGX0_9BACI|nr:NADH-quinone oxidoreductase subunit M [Bacillus solimangrovi]OEH93328.1 NADH-quinone oxidoreductase subunit M [Bacillus solimangrovi]